MQEIQLQEEKESKEICFTVYTKVIGKQRPRVTTINGYARAFTPAKTTAFENEIKQCFFENYNVDDIFARNIPLEATIVCNIKIQSDGYNKNKGILNKLGNKKLSGEIKPIVKPDIDNVAKSVLDALNGYAYVDDSQICKLTITKKYSQMDSFTVSIKEMNHNE